MNNALAKNKIAPGISPVYQEFFAEYEFPASEKITVQIFADYATDPFVNEDHRYTTGFTADAEHSRLSSVLEAELQYTERIISQTITFINTYFSYTISYGSKFSASVILENTNDPIHVKAGKHQNYYPALNLTYRPDNHFRISVFGGKRRGGPACNSGVCYDVLDFEGLEIRLTTRF